MTAILKSTEQTGEEFVGAEGLGQVLLHSAVATKNYTLQIRSKIDTVWVDTDVIFDGVGLQTFYSSPDWVYRMVAEDAASVGAVAYFTNIGL